MEAKENAERLSMYFERIAREFGGEVWDKGRKRAQEWLRLIDADNLSQTELATFMGVVHANRYRSSGWFDLAGCVYQWAVSQGFAAPSVEVFFSPDIPSGSRFEGILGLDRTDQARLLIELFDRNIREDPNYDTWTIGASMAREWLRLIQTQDVTQPVAAGFVQRVEEFKRKFLSSLWFDFALGVYDWCGSIGYWDLVPDDYHMILKRRR
jgi:hypothetical protein